MTLTLKNTHTFFFYLKLSDTQEHGAWGHGCVTVKALGSKYSLEEL